MKRSLVLVPLALSLALAGGAEFSGELSTTFGLRTSDLAIAAQQVGFRLTAGYKLDDAELSAELKAGPLGVRLGEAYARVSLGPVDLLAGNLVVSTGRTDLFSPEDAFNPKDLSRPLADPKALKVPVPAVEVNYYPDPEQSLALELLYSPTFTPSTPPQGDWAQPQPAMPGVVEVNQTAPGASAENGVFGLRVSDSFDVLEGLDVGFTLLHTYTPFPGPKRLDYLADKDTDANPQNGPFRLVLGYDRTTLVGGDFALAFSIPDVAEGLVLRGEAAYRFTADAAGTDPYTQNPGLDGVLELEYRWPDGPTTQLLYQLSWQKADAPAPDTLTHRAALLAQYDADERTRLEGAWIQNISDGSGMLAPRVRYTLADGVEAHAALAFFYGKDGSEFGAWRANTELDLGLDYSF